MEVEIIWKPETGTPSGVIEQLNRSIGQYKRNYYHLKIGITGQTPEERLASHLKNPPFKIKKMVVLYQTSSEKFIREIEAWLVDQHFDYVHNKTGGGGGPVSKKEKHNYLYLLLG